MADTVANQEVSVEVVNEPVAAHVSDDALLDQTLDQIHKNDEPAGDKTVDELVDAEKDKEVPVEKPVVVDEQKGDESKNGDASKDDNKGDEPAAEEDEDFNAGDLSIAALNSRLAKDAAFKAVVDADPAFKRQLFYAARRAERSNQYDDLFHTPALAKESKAAADRAYEDAQLYEGEDSEKFFQSLRLKSVERDEQGRVKLDVNDRPIDSGAYDRHMTHYRNSWYSAIEDAAKNFPDDHVFTVAGEQYPKADVLEALKILRAVTDGPKQGAAQATPSKDLPPEVQAQLAELDRIKASQKTTDAQSLETFRATVKTETEKAIEASVRGLMANVLPKDNALGDYFKDTIARDTVSAILELASKNRAHQDVVNRAIKNAQRNDEGAKKIVDITKAYAREFMSRELRKVLAKATPAVLAMANSTKDKVTEQKNRVDMKASGGVSTPSRPDAKALARTIDANARKQGKVLSDEDFLDQVVEGIKTGR